MIAAIVAAGGLFVADATVPPGLPALREVVYKVSTSLQVSGNSQSYEGMNSTNNYVTDQGTVTVDIMVVNNGILGIDVTEVMDKKGTKSKYQGNVAADGTVNFAASSINDATREILPYFGTKFDPIDTANVGAKWKTSLNRGGAQIDSEYAIMKLDGSLLNLGVNQKVSIKSTNATGNTTGTIVFKPTLLVPLRGDLQKIFTQTTPEGFVKQTLSVHFERVSDSRDT